jgi:hypothetical protein
MLRNGQLPGTRDCACCRRPTDGLSRVTVECERVAAVGGPSQAEVVGCLLTPLIGWFLALLIFLGLRSRRQQYGDDVSVTLPLPVCEACRPGLDDPTAARHAIRRVPAYAELLDHYPEARVTRLG